MNIATTRFGTVEIQEADVLFFEAGLIGFVESKRWVILADTENQAVAWLQCLQDPSLAMAGRITASVLFQTTRFD